ncbi:DUF2336 domain-containing protein [Methylobacterium sp. NEAU 140]|uniref:DUF2336 domain-containing protein n=1 Tax=Methylobacterium sp. NEAU 140 TaxID=3064945 RepID=UPI0027338D53|nr:DUF2336 domain-containing protein [Methylobacterium sp. NEAU 140]MDP4025799.1 DUF2336 domain-containing protein [Methylobacterium sp. NEAU 140]
MILRQFLALTQNAPAARRAEAAAALAEIYLYGDLAADAAWEAKTALLALLDDPAPVVRRALAEACAASARAPRPLVVALSTDVPEVAGPVLARSPVLTDADLVDAAALGDAGVRAVIARRHHLAPAVSGALAEIGEAETLVALAANPTARITAGRLLRMVERHGASPALREALLVRPDLPPEVRHAVVLAVARSLSAFVTACGWLGAARCERMEGEATERAALDVCDGAGAAAVGRLVRHLRAARQLTAGLILRAVLSGRSDFVAAALADLTGLDHAAVARGLRDGRGVADLHRRAGLPEPLLPAMQAALAAARGSADAPRGAGLSRRMIAQALAACEAEAGPETRAVGALLTRYESEAARDAAREAARAVAEAAASREALRRETLAADAAWRAALAAQRPEPEAARPEIDAAEPVAVAAVPEPALAAADAPFNPVGAILDALPGQILEHFRAERDGVAEPIHPQVEAAAAVLDGLDADLLAAFRSGRGASEDLAIAA